jgi:hypothetical protein
MSAASVQGIDGQVMNVASGEAVSLAHLWSLACELAGSRRDAPAPAFRPAPSWEPAHVRVSGQNGWFSPPMKQTREGLWPRPARAVPPPPLPLAVRQAATEPPAVDVEMEELEPDPPEPEWAPVPAPWGVG